MVQDRFTLTRAGYEDLQRELERLEAEYDEHLNQLGDVIDDVDPSPEEAAYFEARTMKEHFGERRDHLRLVLEHADIVDEDPDPTRIDPGDRVLVWDFGAQQLLTFDILGSEEVIHGREGVSMESPVGQALIGRRVGDVIEVDVPNGRAKYAIREISHPA